MELLIVGLGSMGKRRARLIAELGGHSVCGVDDAPARRQEAEALGIPAYAAVEQALAARRFDAAFVCTAPLAHHQVAKQLLNAGLSVFCEINLVADGYEELMDAAARTGQTLFLSSTMLYRAETRHITAALRGHTGPAGYVYHIGQYLPDWHPWENYKDFFVGDARTGGVREILGIDLPWLLNAFGPVSAVSAAKNTLSSLDLPYADSLFLMLRHHSGHTGLLCADVVSPKAVRNFELFADGLHLFWEGSPETLFTYDPATKQKVKVDAYQSYQQDARYSDNIVEDAYREEIENFFAVMAGKEQPLWSFKQDLEVIRLIDQIEAL